MSETQPTAEWECANCHGQRLIDHVECANCHGQGHGPTQAHGHGGPELFAALAAFQATKPVARMDAVNPHFKSKYATLASVTDAAQGAAEHGLSVSQLPGDTHVTTMLCHSSGQYVRVETPILSAKDNAHGFGAGVTYARRFSLSAILGIAADEDDDGNAAVETSRKAKHHKDFTDGNTKFIFPRLKAIGLDVEMVNDYLVIHGRPRLSATRREKANDLLIGLEAHGSEIRNHFDAWRASR